MSSPSRQLARPAWQFALVEPCVDSPSLKDAAGVASSFFIGDFFDELVERE